MNTYEKFQTELKEQKEASYKDLISEVNSLRNRFEKIMTMAMNTTTAKAERDYRVRTF